MIGVHPRPQKLRFLTGTTIRGSRSEPLALTATIFRQAKGTWCSVGCPVFQMAVMIGRIMEVAPWLAPLNRSVPMVLPDMILPFPRAGISALPRPETHWPTTLNEKPPRGCKTWACALRCQVNMHRHRPLPDCSSASHLALKRAFRVALPVHIESMKCNSFRNCSRAITAALMRLQSWANCVSGATRFVLENPRLQPTRRSSSLGPEQAGTRVKPVGCNRPVRWRTCARPA